MIITSPENSPRSSALPSPPDSPAGSFSSSLPSVSSSFFFSSAAASPGQHPFHIALDTDNDSDQYNDNASNARGATRSLIIPSLVLPTALRRPTPYGQTLGDVRLLVLGSQGAGKSFLTGLLLEDNEEVVEVGTWEDPADAAGGAESGVADEMELLAIQGAKVLQASTAWIEHKDAHGLDRFEPARNVEIVELAGYDVRTDGDALVNDLKSIIYAPFRSMAQVIHPNTPPSALIANLVSSSSTPLFTALILLLPSAPTPLDRKIMDSLSGDIPLIILSTPPSSSSLAAPGPTHPRSPQSFLIPAPHIHTHTTTAKMSAFRPRSATELKHGLFHSPTTIATLRTEAAERFLRWREVERAVAAVRLGSSKRGRRRGRLGGVGGAMEQEDEDCHPPLSSQPATARRRLRGRQVKSTPRLQILIGGRQYSRSCSRERSRSRSRGAARSRSGLRSVWDRWDREKWEREWMAELSRDTHRRLNAAAPLHLLGDEGEDEELELDVMYLESWDEHDSDSADIPCSHQTCPGPAVTNFAFDPLHLPSLLLFAVSLLGPLKARLVDGVKSTCGLGRLGRTTTTSATTSSYRSTGKGGNNRSRSQLRTLQLPLEVQEKSAAEQVDSRLRQQGPRGATVETTTTSSGSAGPVPGMVRWAAVGCGLVGVGLCVGVGVGVAWNAAAR